MGFDYSQLNKQRIDFVQINKILKKAFSNIQTAGKIVEFDNEISALRRHMRGCSKPHLR